jgi:hypothetical protein
MNWDTFLTDRYFQWLFGNYSMLIFTVLPWTLLSLLKLLAILSPNAPANQIIELVKGVWPGARRLTIDTLEAEIDKDR